MMNKVAILTEDCHGRRLPLHGAFCNSTVFREKEDGKCKVCKQELIKGRLVFRSNCCQREVHPACMRSEVYQAKKCCAEFTLDDWSVRVEEKYGPAKILGRKV